MPVPVLVFGQRPGGQPPRILVDAAAGTYVRAPAGGPPMRVLRELGSVTTALGYPMAGPQFPLTGADAQDADGHLLAMNLPRLATFRRPVTRLLTPRAAQAARPHIRAEAEALAAALPAHADLRAYTDRLAAQVITWSLGVPLADWPVIFRASRAAFGIIPAGGIGRARREWEALYRYYHALFAAGVASPGGVAAGVYAALRGQGMTDAQAVAAVATTSNGYPALVQVAAVALVWALRLPAQTAAWAAAGDWAGAAGWLIRYHALFPLALPRRAPDGSLVLPSLVAAARHPGAPCGLPFGGPDPHNCPGAPLTRVTVAEMLRAVFTTHPRAQLTGTVTFDEATLAAPVAIPATLR